MICFAPLLALLAGTPLVDTGDLVYVSGVSGSDPAQVLDGLAVRLRTTRLGLRDVASVNVYLADASASPQLEAAWRRSFPRDGPARTLLAATLPGHTAVCVSAVASRKPLRRVAGGAVLTAGTLFLPALAPRDTTAGIDAQTLDVMEQQEAILKAAGLSFSDLVMTRIYLSDPRDYGGLNEAYQRFVTAPPPARATIHARPLVPGERVRIQSVAVEGSGRGRPSGPGITSPIHSYSVRAGNRLYITGMTGRRADGSFDRNNAGAQAEVSIGAIDEQLRRHQMSFDDVADVLVWLRAPEDWTTIEPVLTRLFPKTRPALTVAGVPPSSPDALVEIMMLAVRPR